MIRDWYQQRRVPREILTHGLVQTVADLELKFSDDDDNQDDPIFVCSAGWRSGSTLLQRLICSDPSILIWGEPFGDHIPVPRMASVVSGLDTNMLHQNSCIDNFDGPLTGQWIANLNPGIPALRAAHRAHFDQLLAKTARQRGYKRWGAKWVRLTAGHATYLKWLYPKAKFVFLVRHVLTAYQSYKKKKWFTVRPHGMTYGVKKFSAHWGMLAASFLDQAETIGGMVIRYEDLVSDPNVSQELESFLGLHLDHSLLTNKVGSRNRPDLRINPLDRSICYCVAGREMKALGYSVSGKTLAFPGSRELT